ncbi:hypothetical protein FIU87_04525 [Bacillus sp. THAF10]|uniref:DUF2812 domain-containing protein n=1 Tax=Bacillus sp. THAF10 TaxID=2587848 RepID=UPI0012683A6B|nr:DUF2812 domain-containing protein [Bacillus sp. THAF10]QFT87913.1 hypothetical protein FIU87_04525 [Bacillus sp. THAF10]
MKTCVRPLWSYNVQKTEKWLTDQAEQGYQLTSFHRIKRRFIFTKKEAKTVTYRIGHDKNQTRNLSSSLKNDGWEMVAQSGSWYMIANAKPAEEVKTSISREAILKRNKFLMYFFLVLLIYLTWMALMNVALLLTPYVTDIPVEKVESPYWIITYIALGLAVVFYLFMLFSVLKIRKTNKALSLESQGTYSEEFVVKNISLSKAEQKQFKREGKIMKRWKFGWMYSPDKLENWLEEMAKKGYQLIRVGKPGTSFYFLKGEPRNVKFCADYQHLSNDTYYEIHREAGWQDEFRSFSSMQKWTIWSKEYEEGEEVPQLYSDKTHQLKHARKIAFSYTALFLPLVLMYLFFATLNIPSIFQKENVWSIHDTNTIMFFILIILFGSFITRTWMYYYRLKRA